ncbi:MAG: hypothetical protein SGARI_002711 [Bacillariaceae sp.]
MEYPVTNSIHPSCFKLPRKLTTGDNKITIEEFVEEILQDGGEALLDDESKATVLAALVEAASKKKTKKKKEGDDGEEEETVMTRIKAIVKEEGDEPKTKKVKTAGGTAQDEMVEAMLPLYRKYHKLKTDELKDYLKWNNQIQKGNKEFNLYKVMDGMLHGRLAVWCLKFLEGDFKEVHCSGRKDEQTYQITRCSWTAVPDQAPRFQPFYTQEPVKTKAAMNKLIEDAQGKNQYVDEGMTQDLLNAADELDVNFDSMEGKKKAVADFRALVEGKLDLPSNRDPTMELGKLILADTSLSKKEIMQAIIEKFGFAEAKKKQAEDRLEAAEKGCRNDANADLLLAFKECAGYYFKEGNGNAGNTYNKAIATIKDMTEEITAENAMSFSKGKTKLPGIGKGTAEKMKEFRETGT